MHILYLKKVTLYKFTTINPKFLANYSTSVKGKKKIFNTLGNILDILYKSHISKNYICNIKSQTAIEELLFDQYELLFKNYKGYSVGGINIDFLTPKLKAYLLEKNEDLVNRISGLREYYATSSNKIKKLDTAISPVIIGLSTDFILNLCFLHFIIISSYQHSDEKEKFYSINVAMDIGKKMIRKYLYTLKQSDTEYKNISYSVCYTNKISNDKILIENLEDDKVIAYLGYTVIQILESCEMINSD